MARGKGRGKRQERGRKPAYTLSFSYKVNDEYKKASGGGLWKAGKDAPDWVVLSGNLSGEYLETLVEFLERAMKKDKTVYVNIGKPSKKKDRDDDDDDDEDNEDNEKEDRDDDESPF